MTSFIRRSARHFLAIRAAEEIQKEIIEKVSLDKFKTLADDGRSIVGTYLNGCSDTEKASWRLRFNTLAQMGVTPDMVLTALARQMPAIASMMEGKEDYKRSEIQALEQSLKEG